MLSKKIEDALNKQIGSEAYACHYYLAMASWCDKKGLRGSARFMYQHAEDERMHMMKLFRYITDTGGHAIVQAVKQPPSEFESIKNIFELTLEHEKHVTKSINDLVSLCLEDKDYSTFNFLQWYVAEQHEEEHQFQYLLDRISIAGLEGRGLFHLDKEIESLAGEMNSK